jgi:hypothetical protein
LLLLVREWLTANHFPWRNYLLKWNELRVAANEYTNWNSTFYNWPHVSDSTDNLYLYELLNTSWS